MSARRISAVVCAALAVTFASGSAALAYSTDSVKPPSTTDDPCSSDRPDVLRGTNGDDTGDTLNAKAKGLTGPITICGFGGNDTIVANDDGDTIYGGPGSDHIYGGADNDYIEGQGGDDYIDGGAGNDTLLGQTGNDTIISNDGKHDVVDGGTGRNQCNVDLIDTVSNCQ